MELLTGGILRPLLHPTMQLETGYPLGLCVANIIYNLDTFWDNEVVSKARTYDSAPKGRIYTNYQLVILLGHAMCLNQCPGWMCACVIMQCGSMQVIVLVGQGSIQVFRLGWI